MSRSQEKGACCYCFGTVSVYLAFPFFSCSFSPSFPSFATRPFPTRETITWPAVLSGERDEDEDGVGIYLFQVDLVLVVSNIRNVFVIISNPDVQQQPSTHPHTSALPYLFSAQDVSSPASELHILSTTGALMGFTPHPPPQRGVAQPVSARCSLLPRYLC